MSKHNLSNIKKNENFLKYILSIKKNKKALENLIQNSSKSEINTLSEIIFNILKGNLKCNPILRFEKERKLIRFLGDPKKNHLEKRKLFKKSVGKGLLLPILGSAIPILLSFLQ